MKKYENIYHAVLLLINDNFYKVDECLPTEKELCAYYQCSRATIRHALQKLENDGYIRRIQGKGSVVLTNAIQHHTVLLIIPNIFTSIFSDIVKGIEQTLRSKNISLLIANSYNDPTIERSIIEHHIDFIDAIIIEPALLQFTKYSESKTYQKLLDKPTICIDATFPNFPIPSLLVNDYLNMKLVTSHVLNSRKVSKILILSKVNDLRGQNRLLGIIDTLTEYNKHTEKKIDYHIIKFNSENEHKRLDDFAYVYFHYKPECIMFYNDEYAARFLEEYNVDPEKKDIVVTGFDNSPLSNGFPYNFISPNHPKEIMGIDAANTIIDALHKHKKITSKVYTPQIDFNDL